MFRGICAATATMCLAAGMLAAIQPATASAAPTCVYTPTLPARISVNQDVVGMKVTLHVAGGSQCTDEFNASTSLVHSTDSYFLSWDNFSGDSWATTDSESVYAFEIKPGTYRTTASDCSPLDADTGDSLSCSVTTASTIIKFTGRAQLKATRLTGKNKKKVTLTVATSRYDGFGPVKIADTVAIQVYTGGKWHTIRNAKTTAAHGYTWTYTRAAKSKYRVLSAETASSFAGTSATVTK